MPTLETGRRMGLAEVETGFTAEQARCEANRCLRCFANIMLDVDRVCALCALCSDVCPVDVISLVPSEEIDPDRPGAPRCCWTRPRASAAACASNAARPTRCRWGCGPEWEFRHDRGGPTRRRRPSDRRIAGSRATTRRRSIFRSPARVTPRDRAAGHWSNFVLHIYPVKMRRNEIRFRYSYYLGVISTVLLGSLVASGIYLMFFYVPSPELGLRGHPEPPDRGHLRPVHPQRAPLVGPPDGAGGRRPHGPGVLPGCLQVAPRVQLGHRRGPAGAHPADVLHRLPAAVGPAGLLGGHGRAPRWPATCRSSAAPSRRCCSAGRRSERPPCCGSTCSTWRCCPRSS